MASRISRWLLALVLSAMLVGACGPAILEPTPRPTDASGGEAMAPSPAAARDAALAYLAGSYPEADTASGLTWMEDILTPEGLVGSSTLQYTADGWVVTVSFPIVAPQATIYHVVVTEENTGFEWEGDLDAQGQIIETGAEGGKKGIPPGIEKEEVDEVVNGNSTFALDLYQALRGKEGNLFFSPYSISLALAMTYAGARGETEDQMASALRFTLPQGQLHAALSELATQLASRGQGARGKDGEGFRLNIVNALWGQEGYPFLPEFLDLLATYYGASLTLLDFAGDPEAARVTINDWASEQTEGRIEDLVPPGVIDTLTRLVLTNAIYFNAAWALPFEPDMTEDGPFYLLDGGEVTVPFMRETESLAYAEGDGYQAVELYYDGHEMSMVILLPGAGQFESFEGAMNADQVAAVLERLHRRQVTLALPRFEFESSFSLKEALTALGMPDAFTAAADFSGMTGNRELSISEVIHKAFVSVDEAGTEAAAATAVMMTLSSALPETPVDLTVDRPFLFVIRDVHTGTLLFVGRVVDPTA